MTTTAPSPATRGAAPGPRPALATYAVLDLRRQLRDRVGMFFIVALPSFMYVVFGLGSDERLGSGDVAMYVMTSMATYAAVTATTTVAGGATLEQVAGCGRQLALTPLRPLAVVGAKAVVAMAVAAVAIALVFMIGAVTGASGEAGDWALSALVIWLGSAMFAIYGLAICLVFRGPNTPGIASGLIVVMAFLGNVFTPMDGLMLDLGRLTPMYGFAALAHYPQADGRLPLGGHDPLWLPVANVLAWTVLFSLLALWGLRRSRART